MKQADILFKNTHREEIEPADGLGGGGSYRLHCSPHGSEEAGDIGVALCHFSVIHQSEQADRQDTDAANDEQITYIHFQDKHQ